MAAAPPAAATPEDIDRLIGQQFGSKTAAPDAAAAPAPTNAAPGGATPQDIDRIIAGQFQAAPAAAPTAPTAGLPPQPEQWPGSMSGRMPTLPPVAGLGVQPVAPGTPFPPADLGALGGGPPIVKGSSTRQTLPPGMPEKQTPEGLVRQGTPSQLASEVLSGLDVSALPGAKGALPTVKPVSYKAVPEEEALKAADRRLDTLPSAFHNPNYHEAEGGPLAGLRSGQVMATLALARQMPKLQQQWLADDQQLAAAWRDLNEYRKQNEGLLSPAELKQYQRTANSLYAQMQKHDARGKQLGAYIQRAVPAVINAVDKPLHTGINYPAEGPPREDQGLSLFGMNPLGGTNEALQQVNQARALLMAKGEYPPPVPFPKGVPVAQQGRLIGEKNAVKNILTQLGNEMTDTGVLRTWGAPKGEPPQVGALGQPDTAITPGQAREMAKHLTPWQKSLIPTVRAQMKAEGRAREIAGVPGALARDIATFGAAVLAGGPAGEAMGGLTSRLLAPLEQRLIGGGAGQVIGRFLLRQAPRLAAGAAGGAGAGGAAGGVGALLQGAPLPEVVKSTGRGALQGTIVGAVGAGLAPDFWRSARQELGSGWDPTRSPYAVVETAEKARESYGLSNAETTALEGRLTRIGKAPAPVKEKLFTTLQQDLEKGKTAKVPVPPPSEPTAVPPEPRVTTANGSSLSLRHMRPEMIQAHGAAAAAAGDMEGAAQASSLLAAHNAHEVHANTGVPHELTGDYAKARVQPGAAGMPQSRLLRASAESFKSTDPDLAQKLHEASDLSERGFRRNWLAGQGVESAGPQSPPVLVSPWRRLTPDQQNRIPVNVRTALLVQDAAHSLESLNPGQQPVHNSTDLPGKPKTVNALEKLADQLYGQASAATSQRLEPPPPVTPPFQPVETTVQPPAAAPQPAPAPAPEPPVSARDQALRENEAALLSSRAVPAEAPAPAPQAPTAAAVPPSTPTEVQPTPAAPKPAAKRPTKLAAGEWDSALKKNLKSLKPEVETALHTDETGWLEKELGRLRGTAMTDRLPRTAIISAAQILRTAAEKGETLTAESAMEQVLPDWKSVGEGRFEEGLKAKRVQLGLNEEGNAPAAPSKVGAPTKRSAKPVAGAEPGAGAVERSAAGAKPAKRVAEIPKATTYDAAQSLVDQAEDRMIAKYGEKTFTVPARWKELAPDERAHLEALYDQRDRIGKADDQAALEGAMGTLRPESRQGFFTEAQVRSALEAEQKEHGLRQAFGEARTQSAEALKKSLYNRLSNDAYYKGKQNVPDQWLGDYDAVKRLAEGRRWAEQGFGQSPKPLLNQVNNIVDDLLGTARPPGEKAAETAVRPALSPGEEQGRKGGQTERPGFRRGAIRIGPGGRAPQSAPGPPKAVYDDPTLESYLTDNWGRTPVPDLKKGFREVVREKAARVRGILSDMVPGVWDNPQNRPGLQKLLRLQRLEGIAKQEAHFRLNDQMGDLSLDEFRLASAAAVLRDLAEDVQNGVELPPGLTPEQIAAEMPKLQAKVAANPAVGKALQDFRNDNKAVASEWRQSLIDIGQKPADLDREDYFRHEVQMERQRLAEGGGGGRLKATLKPTFTWEREGGVPFNTHLIEATQNVKARMIRHIEENKIIRFFQDPKNGYNIQPLIEARKALAGDAEAQQWFQNAAGGSGGIIVRAIPGRIGKMAQMDQLPNDPNGKWDAVIREIGNNVGANEARPAGSPPIPIDPSMTGALSDYARQVLEWSAAKPGQPAGELGAIPPTHQEYRFVEGNNLYRTTALSPSASRLAEAVAQGVTDTMTVGREDLRSVLAVGRRRGTMVLPNEWAAALNRLRPEEPSIYQRVWRKVAGGLKSFAILNPEHLPTFFREKAVSDATRIFRGNPAVFAELPQAAEDLFALRSLKAGRPSILQLPHYAVTLPNWGPAPMLRDWLFHEGARGLMANMEGGTPGPAIDLLEHLAATGPKTSWQETRQILKGLARLGPDRLDELVRYAGFRSFRKAIAEHGEPQAIGAARRDLALSLTDPDEQAHFLSNHLFGAYDEIPASVKWLRERLPFPYFGLLTAQTRSETNLFLNAIWREPKVYSSLVRGLGLEGVANKSKSTVRATNGILFWGKLMTILGGAAALNYLTHRKDEEEMDDPTPHLDLGHAPGGGLVTWPRLGALPNAATWFGLDDPMGWGLMAMNGHLTKAEIIKHLERSGPAEFMSLVGLAKAPVELAMGRRIATGNRIDDKMEYIAQQAHVPLMYEAARRAIGAAVPKTGILPRPMRGGILGQVTATLAGGQMSDPGDMSYRDAAGRAREWVQQERGIGNAQRMEMQFTPLSGSLYYYKKALEWGDGDTALKYLAAYVNNGGSDKTLHRDLAKMEPLYGLNKVQMGRYLKTLGGEDRAQVRNAYRFWQQFTAKAATVRADELAKEPNLQRYAEGMRQAVDSALGHQTAVRDFLSKHPVLAGQLKQAAKDQAKQKRAWQRRMPAFR